MAPHCLHLPASLKESLIAAATRAYPFECCGLLVGSADTHTWHLVEIHESDNLAENRERRFEIDPALQFRLLRTLRVTARAVVGCFHSHPDGAPAPSATDLEGALEDRFLWLVLGGNPDKGFAIGAFVFEASAKRFERMTIEDRR